MVPLSVVVGLALFFLAIFAPILFSGNFMTSGDGVVQAIPTYFGRNPLVEPNLMLGYPLFADPNQAFWYPFLRIARAIPGAFNAYVLLPYIIVAIGTFGFAKRVSGSWLGAIAAAIIVALSGFMISHQGHLMIIHPACWAPLVLWTFAELRDRSNRLIVCGGALAFAFGASAGTQQALVYLTFVGVAFAITFRPSSRKRTLEFIRDIATIMLAGAALSAVAIVPSAQFALHTDRAHQTIADLNVDSTQLVEFPYRALFPYIFGGSGAVIYSANYRLIGAFTETTNYAGVFSLLLALIAIFGKTVKREALFWTIVAAWAVWLSLGERLGAAWVARLIPIYNLFRIPSRHAFEFAFAIAMLAALGVAEMENRRVSWRRILISISIMTTVFATAVITFASHGRSILASVMQTADISTVPVMSSSNAAIAIPVATLAGSCLVLLIWKRFTNVWTSRLAVACIALDMALFADASYWRYTSVSPSILQSPQSVATLKKSLRELPGRYLDLGDDTTHVIPSNLATLWGLPNATGYVSLEDKSFESLMQASPTGVVPVQYAAEGNATALDLASVRYLLLPRDGAAVVAMPLALQGPSINGFIGSPSIAPQQNISYDFTQPRSGDVLEIVSALGDSIAIPNRAPVADLVIETSSGSLRFPLRAGIDTSESAYDRPDVHDQMKHARSTVFSGPNDAHLYLAKINVPNSAVIRSVSLEWTYDVPNHGALTIAQIALVDEPRHVAYPIFADGQFSTTQRHFIDRSDIYANSHERILENNRAFPHAWITNQSIIAQRPTQLQIIRSGTSNGRRVNFEHEVLTSDSVTLGPADAADRVVTVSTEPTMDIEHVECKNLCMLVTDDLWYPGWTASIDGKAARVSIADYAFRGVLVPAGSHEVTLQFKPLSLQIGATISIVSFCFLLIWAFILKGRRSANR